MFDIVVVEGPDVKLDNKDRVQEEKLRLWQNGNSKIILKLKTVSQKTITDNLVSNYFITIYFMEFKFYGPFCVLMMFIICFWT